MIRSYFHKLKKTEKEKINWRSHEPTRIEAFSDTVFGFALSLLVISLEVPKSSQMLLNGMMGFIPFLFCFLIIFHIWREQYKFFRRYGMHDRLTFILNAVLIFMVLFLVYPLKFLFGLMWPGSGYIIRPQDYIPLVVVYNVAFAIIYFNFSLMYINALMKKKELGLTPMEVFETRSHLYSFLFPTTVATIVALFAVLGGKYSQMAMGLYFLMGGLGIFDARRNKLFKKKFGNVPVAEPELNPE